MNRRYFLFGALATGVSVIASKQTRYSVFQSPLPLNAPNVLMLSIDDLGANYKELRAITPNLDYLTGFTNAQCPGPICGPSRTALLLGQNPSTTGIYYNGIDFRFFYPDTITLPQYFRQNGYYTAGSGKVFHPSGQPLHDIGYSWDNYPVFTLNFKPHPPSNVNGYNRNSPWYWRWDWQIRLESKDNQIWSDTLNANVIIDLIKNQTDEPWFFALGNVSCHIPWYAPQEFFDLYSNVDLPLTIPDDLEDCGLVGQNWAHSIGMLHQWIVDNPGKWQEALKGYLACISFMDWQIGRVLDTLYSSRFANNTIVVLWSDHGQHFGQKEHWGKNTLWGESANVPLYISDMSTINQPIGLVDLYPTLCDLVGLPIPNNLDGQSLKLLTNGQQQSTHGLCTYGPGNHSVRSGNWKYISYEDGSSEVYRLSDDPSEWYNQVDREDIKNWLERYLPKEDAKPVQRYDAFMPLAMK
jgi:arylsulfatase A-like enzyme